MVQILVFMNNCRINIDLSFTHARDKSLFCEPCKKRQNRSDLPFLFVFQLFTDICGGNGFVRPPI